VVDRGKKKVSQELVDRGVSRDQIAKELNTTKGAVVGACNRFNFLGRRGLLAKENRALFLQRERRCPTCLVCKRLQDYYPGCFQCKSCCSDETKARYRGTLDGRLKVRLAAAKIRAERKGLPFYLTVEQCINKWNNQGDCVITHKNR
jgi:hypothetical protein